jgi:hypothetical protein
MTTDEAKAKGKKFSELAKKNELMHNLGMTGYAGKRLKWQKWLGKVTCYKASTRGHVTTSMPVGRRS